MSGVWVVWLHVLARMNINEPVEVSVFDLRLERRVRVVLILGCAWLPRYFVNLNCRMN